MAIACSFDESNLVLDKPPGMTYEECEALSVWRGQNSADQPVVISCWKLTVEEFEEIRKTRRVWLMVYGDTMQPAVVCGKKPFGEQA